MSYADYASQASFTFSRSDPYCGLRPQQKRMAAIRSRKEEKKSFCFWIAAWLLRPSRRLFSPKQPGSLTPSARRQTRLQGRVPETGDVDNSGYRSSRAAQTGAHGGVGSPRLNAAGARLPGCFGRRPLAGSAF